MKKEPMSRVLAACLLATLWAAPAFAQSPAAGGDPLAGGPQIAGLCLLSQTAVLSNAKVGLAATARLQYLTQQTQTGLNGEIQALQSEGKALEAKRASLKSADFQQQQQALATRYKALQDRAALLSRAVEATRVKALNQIDTQERPVIAQVYKARGCGLLLDRNSVIAGNLAGDLTAGVVAGLDAKITTITFDLEPAPASSAP